MYRQGDVLLVPHPPVEGIATSSTVAEGEASGHHHIVFGGEVLEKYGNLFVKAPKEGAVLRHIDTNKGEDVQADHGPIEIPEGTYRVVIQSVYDPFTGWARATD